MTSSICQLCTSRWPSSVQVWVELTHHQENQLY